MWYSARKPLNKKVSKQVKELFKIYGSDKLLDTLNYSKKQKEQETNSLGSEIINDVSDEAYKRRLVDKTKLGVLVGLLSVSVGLALLLVNPYLVFLPISVMITAYSVIIAVEKSEHNKKLIKLGGVGQFISLYENYGKEVLYEVEDLVDAEYQNLLRKGDAEKLEQFRQANQMVLSGSSVDFIKQKTEEIDSQNKISSEGVSDYFITPMANKALKSALKTKSREKSKEYKHNNDERML